MSFVAQYAAQSGETIRKLVIAPVDIGGLQLVALGTDSSVELVWIATATYDIKQAHTFFLGNDVTVTALDWSARTRELSREGTSTAVYVELLVATAKRELWQLSGTIHLDETASGCESLLVARGRSSHRGQITSVSFCRGKGYEGVAATASDDGAILIWNLDSTADPLDDEISDVSTAASNNVRRPTCSTITLPHGVLSVAFHPAQFGTLMAFDVTGSMRLIAWTAPNRPTLMTLTDPRSASDYRQGMSSKRGAADWKISPVTAFGALIGDRCIFWDLANDCNGRPLQTVSAFTESGDIFRWSSSDWFAIATSASNPSSAPIRIIDSAYPQRPFEIGLPRRATVHDLAWFTHDDILAIAAGSQMLVCLPSHAAGY
ncbi:uncharacterized protein L969DRAFT_17944 [Mixia osmundae IAM 14324]|uniref:Uncharacterized protein n=1 Tax=Mixia osmundae (strain CBS 9802 / IAM 14324 / JCM 22182 / KY 12970) TaxID=764103 RepID=G7E0Z2_MIXOS|nr:uncharacterized protein L969DRAFT_17944 [Mixia osmundae IAM 14324]KEI38863.1 hypothetical protein L969DRAFT_17944 [Mixia osmundae IAM 14324]GAA96502.1 hypothetical protein E5Q_03170 [Mixia osmundae IAM 14324]